ncbi:MAG: Asp-tRNA(Asn)/Glu-tRNA(Gln) amidotransferase subunit GatC [Gammaproteobacteria bacterium]|nr:Asp-tRNA(Asn)/Glu-tRNA(Gln) amidotransferase subunit GatC [Gammaproteobacteria bacterium]NIR84216.1 Asp-tRNA(Asn)/Glu-tRNA(Gln) amidotransferase subunit GatC [Gammaproteobacteria bacterium]NIR89686.1 Asp-tRNA(Asn)/Glu-tRNA(Gln) amidotransferase subunit GatC [Gammaproteobacteria bacterium]NIU05374.1 Asp-tRNA(Asn)/Glu-tRNA(Gln) amidotransferase subunit GatC [Gammaproteobacteria bacterium]NIV52320.1 Asp-tRNA(Asn)/Glu-tRNA(Gln) amidotransferase subunit GatC [Gammaproteobacteria bacterium]
MAIDRAQVEKIAHLARLAIDEEEAREYARQLSDILDLVHQMNAMDTAQVTPMAHPLNMAQRLRSDQIAEHDQRERFQAVAPAVEGGLYLVPKVIE